MTTKYETFTTHRKQSIIAMKRYLTTDIEPTWNRYGTKWTKLSHQHYVLYAALRGADIRKTANTNPERAYTALKNIITIIPRDEKMKRIWTRFPDIETDTGHQWDYVELREILETELARYTCNEDGTVDML